MSAVTTTMGEDRVCAAAQSGEPADLSGLQKDQRVLSTNVIRELCVGAGARNVDSRGLHIIHARILEPLDLSFCTVPFPLRFDATCFRVVPDLSWARLPALQITDCSLPGLICRGIRVDHLRLGSENGNGKNSITGEVSLHRAKIGGNLNCYGATLNNKRGHALTADGAEIQGDVLLRRFSANGEVRFHGAKIGGNLDCMAATLKNDSGCALAADGAEIDGSVILTNFRDEGFSATGVRLVRAKIGDNLVCSGATLSNERDGQRTFDVDETKGFALLADGAEISGSVFLDNARATGVVSLSNARIGALVCSGATLTSKSGWALEAERAEIDSHVYLNESNDAKFSARGGVQLFEARIGGWLYCSDATLENRDAGNEDGIALEAEGATMTGGLLFQSVRVIGGVNLFRASATTLCDDLDRKDHLGSWGGIDPLQLDGFAYTRFWDDATSDAKIRAGWLQKATKDFQHGAWQQLIGVYRAQGRDSDANRAALAMHKDRVKRGNLPTHVVAGRLLLGAAVGHGYREWRAALWAILIIVPFALVVGHYPKRFVAVEGVTGSPQPFAYAADTFLPIINLGQAGNWNPTGWVRWLDWLVILLGWALTTIFVAGFTRIVRRE